MKNKFYVAADRIMDGSTGSTWRKASLAEAVEHAEKLLANEPMSNQKYIVKIIAVVKKQPTPVKVLKVR